jgi:hypothetical protein
MIQVLQRNSHTEKLNMCKSHIILYFEVIFSDDPSVTTQLPYREVKYVQIVRDYIMLHKDELKTATADLRKQKDAPETKRVRRISQSLRGYDH